MTAEDRELFRQALLRQCHAASKFGLPVGRLQHGCKVAGYQCTPDELERELRHLLSLGMIQTVAKALSPAVVRYTTTAEGDNYLEAEGLI